MKDFNEFAKDGGTSGKNNGTGDILGLVGSLASKFDGKSRGELLAAIYREAKKGKKNGTLKNSDIDGFAATISPFLDEKQRGYLSKIVKELKSI